MVVFAAGPSVMAMSLLPSFGLNIGIVPEHWD